MTHPSRPHVISSHDRLSLERQPIDEPRHHSIEAVAAVIFGIFLAGALLGRASADWDRAAMVAAVLGGAALGVGLLYECARWERTP